MKRIIPLVQTIQIDQDNFISDFKKTKLIWNSFDEPLINIQANDVTISNIDLHVKSINKSPSIVIGNSTKMIENITFNFVTISCNSDVLQIMNVKNIKFNNCVFKSKSIRTNIFTLLNVYNISINNCIINGGNSTFLLDGTTDGFITKCKVYNTDFLFNFSPQSISKWKVTNNSFNNIQNMINNKNQNNLFITSNNQFHSSNSTGLYNNLNEFNQDILTSRDLASAFGGFFGGGGGGTSSTPSIPSTPTSVLGKSYSITQILTFIAISFVLLIIVILIIVFIIRLAKK